MTPRPLTTLNHLTSVIPLSINSRGLVRPIHSSSSISSLSVSVIVSVGVGGSVSGSGGLVSCMVRPRNVPNHG